MVSEGSASDSQYDGMPAGRLAWQDHFQTIIRLIPNQFSGIAEEAPKMT